MTNEDFCNLEVDDRVVLSKGGEHRGTVVGYTGVFIQFDDGVVVNYQFNVSHISKSFEREKR